MTLTQMEIIKDYELSIGDYCITVNIEVQLVNDSFGHEFGDEDASYYELINVELSDSAIEYKHLFNLDYIKEVVENELADICQQNINPHTY